MRSTDGAHSSIVEIIKDTMSIVGSLQTFSFSHTRWQGNCATHALAKRAIVSFPLLVWMEHVPIDISHVVISDSPATIIILSIDTQKKKKKSYYYYL